MKAAFGSSFKLTLSTAVFTFAASVASAGVTPGTWVGKTSKGEECSMKVGETFFEKNEHHPLNERIKVAVNGADFVVVHPPVVKAEESMAFFNHDMFQGVRATRTGAQALVIKMEHGLKEGPKEFTFIEHAWKGDVRTSVVCQGIRHTQ